MKSILCIFVLFLLFQHALISGESNKTNDYVKVEFSVKLKVKKQGVSGELLINFKPKEGIHINLDPPVTVKFDSNSLAVSAGKLETSKIKEYLDASKPVKQRFTLSGNSKTALLKGVLTYFYCSAAEGWCSRFKQPFEINVKIK